MFGRLAAALLSAASLTGCGSMVTTVTSYDVLFPAGVPSEFSYAAAGGMMPVVVVGNPFALPQADVDAAVIAAMQGQTFGAQVRFVPAEGESRTTGYAVVMLLDSIGGVRGNTACAWRGRLAYPATDATPDSTPTQAPIDTEPTTLLAAFCGNADARSWAFSTTGAVKSPYSEHFRELVARTTMSMLPPRDDDQNTADFD